MDRGSREGTEAYQGKGDTRMTDLILPSVSGAAPLTPREKANLKQAGDSLGAAAGAVCKTVAAIGTALVDGLKVAGDVATRATYGDLATGPVTLQQLQNRLAAMRERLAILDLALMFEPTPESRQDLLSESIAELFRIGRGEKAVIARPHYWPAGLDFQEVHRRLWAMQTLLASAQLRRWLSDSDIEREKALKETIEAVTRVAQGQPDPPEPPKALDLSKLGDLVKPVELPKLSTLPVQPLGTEEPPA